jgi:membrane associated rhomboid family serine protease
MAHIVEPAPTALIEVYRTGSDQDCRDRALVLVSAEIPASMLRVGAEWILAVDEEHAPRAIAELGQYAAENRRERVPGPVSQSRLDARAWIGSAGYVLVLFLVGYLVASGAWPLDAFDRGSLHGAAVRDGQWWRAVTALTLHVDSGHLAANLGFGAWFGYLAGQHLGPGAAWTVIVGAATLTNYLEGALGPRDHRSVGASTAVFAALGLLAACGWRQGPPAGLERSGRLRRALVRWAPLVAGLALLGFLGTEGESTDLVAHFGGFGAGIALGLPMGSPPMRARLMRLPQRAVGAIPVALVALGWVLALTAG